MIHYCL